jgi:non-ribosomal peptide synthetase component F
LSCIAPHTQLFNSYGVTETTVDCTYRRVLPDDVTSLQSTLYVPIGLPLPNYVCHVITEEEDGSIGELYIGGPGVFRGYLNRNSDSKESRLVEINNEVFYQTGDLFKIFHGELIYKGRRDFQVKIRGLY